MGRHPVDRRVVPTSEMKVRWRRRDRYRGFTVGDTVEGPRARIGPACRGHPMPRSFRWTVSGSAVPEGLRRRDLLRVLTTSSEIRTDVIRFSTNAERPR